MWIMQYNMPDSKFVTYVWHRARLTVKINFEEA